MKKLTIYEKAEKMIKWIGEDAEDAEITDVYNFITGKSDLDLYLQYIERNAERIEKGGWCPVCFVEYRESEECENDRKALGE